VRATVDTAKNATITRKTNGTEANLAIVEHGVFLVIFPGTIAGFTD
jgi:hypothetical protein